MTTLLIIITTSALSAADHGFTQVQSELPDGPTTITENARGRLLFMFGRAAGLSLAWDGARLHKLAHHHIDAPATTHSVTSIRDAFGNLWRLSRASEESPDLTITMLPAGAGDDRQAHAACPPPSPPDSWCWFVVDDLGSAWIAGRPGIAGFDPHQPNAAWHVLPPDKLPKAAVTSLGLSPRGLALAGFADGSLIELDQHADGKLIIESLRLSRLPTAPIRAVCTDRDGAIWAVAAGAIYKTTPNRRWRDLARLPVGNHDFYGAVLDGKLYIAGGITNFGYPPKMAALDLLLAYDPARNRWTPLTPMSVKRGYCGIAALDREIWVLGGYAYDDPASRKQTVLDLVEIYSPKTDSWRPGPALDRPRAELVALTVADRLYVIGGADAKQEFTSVISIAPGQTAWRAEPEAPRAFRQASGCVFDDKIFIGRSPSEKHPRPPGLYVFDPKARRWTTDIPPMPIGPPNAPLTAVHNNEIWVMGGWGTNQPRAVFCYSPKTNAWRSGPDLPIPLGWAAAAEIDGNLVIAGGAYYSPEHRAFIFSNRTFTLLRD
ncbi:MAG: hypothetical protein JXQ73_26725 [Phycisphaerae bacterium]|nr:hypothetical protein [Phycisphaerae bacterium]